SNKLTPGIRPHLEAAFVGLVLFAIAVSGIAFLASEALSVQEKTVKGDLLRMAQAAAGLVNGDLHEKLVSPSQASSQEYKDALAPLVKFHQGVPEIAYLYTLVEKEGHFHFVLDTATAAEQLGFGREMKASGLMEPYQSNSDEEDRAEMEALRQSTSYVSPKPFSDEFGTFLTALAPVRAGDGRTVGVVGLDLDLAEYLRRLNNIWRAVALAAGFVLVASILVGALVFRIRRRLQRQLVSEGNTLAEKEAIEEQDRRLVRALGQIVYHYDAASDRMGWRGECEAILGCQSGEMPDGLESWMERIHPRDAAAREALTIAKESSDTSLIREYRWIHKMGHSVWVLDRAVLTRDASGKLVAVDGVLLDISLRKKAEADLIAARDAAEAAGRAKGDFLAVMSHEIRTPMNGMIGCTNLLLETSITPEQRDYLETVHKCGDSLLHLINDILDFSKMESDKLTLEARPFSLRNCVEEALDLYGFMAAEKKIELLARFENSDLDWMSGDEVRFRQILVNLVGNALKFTASGEVIVTLSRKPWLPGGNALMLSVQDTGIGIPENKQQGIFLPFSQADSSTTRRFGGTGLGLAICGRLATLMGGAITVHSEEGSGAEFVVLIPLRELEEQNPRLDISLLRGRSAVVADDNRACRLMMRDLLESFGMKVSLASDLPELIAGLESGAVPDVLLVDGEWLSTAQGEISKIFLKRRPDGFPHVVELAVPSLTRSREPGGKAFQGYLLKPVRKEALYHLLCGVFSPALDTPEVPPAVPADEILSSRLPLKILVVEDNAINRKVILQILKRLGYSPQIAENGRVCLGR
ncbi:MAG: ATP-binding protein, partial [Terrimicrobiaceae bacterium]